MPVSDKHYILATPYRDATSGNAVPATSTAGAAHTVAVSPDNSGTSVPADGLYAINYTYSGGILETAVINDGTNTWTRTYGNDGTNITSVSAWVKT